MTEQENKPRKTLYAFRFIYFLYNRVSISTESVIQQQISLLTRLLKPSFQGRDVASD